MGFPAIVLAAGASLRLSRPKQLLTLDGETLLARTIRLACEADADPVLLILGAHAAAISVSAPTHQVVTILNADWQEGIASSVRAGVRALQSCLPDATGTLLLVCDQPRLSAAHLRNLIHTFDSSDGAAVVASTYSGARGIPAIFPRLLFARLLALTGDKGARSILADPRCAILEVPFAGGEIDIDSAADLDQLSRGA